MPETIERSRPRSHNRERSDKKNIKRKRSRSKSYNRGRSDITNIKRKRSRSRSYSRDKSDIINIKRKSSRSRTYIRERSSRKYYTKEKIQVTHSTTLYDFHDDFDSDNKLKTIIERKT